MLSKLTHNTKVWLAFLTLFSVLAFVAFINKDSMMFRTVDFSDLKEWNQQDFIKLGELAKNNCQQMELFYQKRVFNDDFGSLEQWGAFCSGLNNLTTEEEIKNHFEKLKLISVNQVFKDDSLFTGYYSPMLQGSFEKTEKYKYPLYKKPKNLVSGNLTDFFPENEDFKYKKIFAKLDPETGKLTPYYDRKDIESNNVISEDEVLIWVDSKIDLFFLHIQGSGAVKLENGDVIYVGYAAQNGQEYKSIGSYFVQKEIMKREDISLQSIKAYLEQNPELTDEILYQNPSYVFFARKGDGPYGAFGMVLTPEYSVAIDRNFIPLGVPLFIKTIKTADDRKFENMVFAQDIGGAIKGQIRADIYFGEDERAEIYAGKQNASGKMYVFSAEEF